MADVVRQSINNLKNLDNFTFVQFDIAMPEDLKISTDQRLLRMIMTSLLENAVVYANDTDPLIKISTEINDQMLQISVRDNGAGIPTEIAPRIFDRYFRGSERSQGAGLGLYTASVAAEKLHGSIILKHSEINRTEFVVELPMDVLNSMAEQVITQ